MTSFGRYIAMREVKTKDIFSIPRGMIVEVVKLEDGTFVAKWAGYTLRIWAQSIKSGGGLLHTSYAEIY